MADPTPQELWDQVAAEPAAGETPTPVVAVEPVVEQSAQTTEVVPVADPYVGFDPEVQAKLRKFDELSDQFPQIVQTLKETQGRVSAMQSEFARRQASTPAAEAPTQRQVAQAAKDPEKWASLKKDFPEWGEGIEAFVDARVGALAGSGMTAEQIEAQIATRVGAETSKLSDEFQRELIATKYPDWDATVKLPTFEAWFAAQKPEVKQLAASPKGRDALQMLDLYHAAQKAPAVRQTRQQVLAAAATVQTKGAGAVATKSFDDLTPKEQWNYLADERARKAAAA